MSFDAKVYKVFIASPGDLDEERRVATEAIREWNDWYADQEKIVLLPIRWETHAVPQYGARPQEAINSQLVDKCDILIGIFWTRIGTNTGVAEGGTIEEIERFISARKPSLIYFSGRHVDLKQVDFDQYKRLEAFKNSIAQMVLLGSFSSSDELRQTLERDLFRQVQMLKSSSTSGYAGKAFAEMVDGPDEDEVDGGSGPGLSEAELLKLGEQRGIGPLLAVLRKIRTAWREELVPSNGSFRYWAEMEGGNRRVIGGFNVAGQKFHSAPGTLHAWICYEPALALGRFSSKQDLLAQFDGFRKSKSTKTRFWFAVAGVADAERLNSIFSSWIRP